MTTVSTQNLRSLVTSALERMAFVFLDDSEATPGEVLARAAAHASIELRGESDFVVTVSVTQGVVCEVASGMMGCDPSEVDCDDHGQATASELANVIGGELVMQMTQYAEGLMIGLPQSLDDEEAGRLADLAGRDGLTCVLGNEDGELLVTFKAD